jgi:hypothetical protein
MKNLFITITICFLFLQAFAQANLDSSAYQFQRKKINNMLADRSKKFGQYDQSLSQHSGIFGFQTKNDIRRSNDILMDIVKTDNDIYTQLKILFDTQTFQQSQVQDHSKETEANNLGFMHTINNLRAEIDKLKKQADETNKSHENTIRNLIILIVFMFASILFLLRSKYASRH